MKSPKITEQHIAVFGESGSGKTVLVSSFFGPHQEGPYSTDLWDLVADDTSQGNQLYQNYLGMRDDGAVPAATRFSATSYHFSVKLRGRDDKRSIDALRLVWHDYPGEWFEESPSSDEEARRRVDTFRSLLQSDVAVLLVDGQRLLDNKGEEERYLKSLFTNFRQGLLRLEPDLLQEGQPLVEFPRIWILALSKADLLPDWDAYTFRDLVIRKAAQHIEELGTTLRGLVHTPEALSIGEDFMVLSSARFVNSADEPAHPASIDVTRRVGLDLILPIASLLPLERRVQWSQRFVIPRDVLDKLADNAGLFAAVLAGGGVVDRVLTKLPKVGRVASKFVVPLLVTAVEKAGPELKELNRTAREVQDYLTATLTQFKLDLDQGGAERLLIRRL
jgi:hypothetical protein